MAHPNARSSHIVATPQGAGLGLMLALLIVCASAIVMQPALGRPSLVPVLGAAGFLVLLGAADDLHSLPVGWRLAGQTLAALAIVLPLPENFRLIPDFLPLLPERALTVLGTVWLVNAINFLDGLDWMTVVEVVPITLGIAVLHAAGVVPASIGLLAMALFGATLGFAWFNKHPAQIFLGDAGSLPIGLCLALMLIYVAEAHLASALLFVLYIFADTTLTLFRRMVAGEPILSAHRSHFYQRAVAKGVNVPRVTARVFLLGVFLAALAVAAALAKSLTVDLVSLTLGLLATGVTLYALARGR